MGQGGAGWCGACRVCYKGMMIKRKIVVSVNDISSGRAGCIATRDQIYMGTLIGVVEIHFSSKWLPL